MKSVNPWLLEVAKPSVPIEPDSLEDFWSKAVERDYARKPVLEALVNSLYISLGIAGCAMLFYTFCFNWLHPTVHTMAIVGAVVLTIIACVTVTASFILAYSILIDFLFFLTWGGKQLYKKMCVRD